MGGAAGVQEALALAVAAIRAARPADREAEAQLPQIGPEAGERDAEDRAGGMRLARHHGIGVSEPHRLRRRQAHLDAHPGAVLGEGGRLDGHQQAVTGQTQGVGDARRSRRRGGDEVLL